MLRFPCRSRGAAAEAWSDDSHVAGRRRIFGEKRALFTRFFDEAGIGYIPTESSFYLWVEAPSDYEGDDGAYALRLLEEGIVVAPGSAFGPGGEGYVRVALVPTLAECERAIEVWRGTL